MATEDLELLCLSRSNLFRHLLSRDLPFRHRVLRIMNSLLPILVRLVHQRFITLIIDVVDLLRSGYNTVINNIAPYQERGGASNNDFIQKGDLNVEAIKANAGIGGTIPTTHPATLQQP